MSTASENAELRNQLAAQQQNDNGIPNISTSPVEGTRKRSQTKKPDRPAIEVDRSETEWSIYIGSWSRYKIMCELTSEIIRNDLRLTCTQAVNRRLIELNGTAVACQRKD